MDKGNFKFTVLTREDIAECATLVASVFSLHDPFINLLSITEQNLISIIEKDLNSILNDNLVIIVKDLSNTICGCYAGFRFNKLTLNKNIITSNTIEISTEGLELNDKLNILDKIDINLLKNSYDCHKEKGELENAIFCDYYCVSKLYFNTNLAKDLAIEFFMNAYKRGIRHVYGSFFNLKAIKIMQKYFNADIINVVEVNFMNNKREVTNKYKVNLLYGNIGKLSNNFKAKF